MTGRNGTKMNVKRSVPRITFDRERRAYLIKASKNDVITIPAPPTLITTIDHYDENKCYCGKTREFWELVSKERGRATLILLYKKVDEEFREYKEYYDKP